MSRDARNSVAIAAIAVAAILLCYPVADMAFNDDWSYSHAVYVFSRTGEIRYDGWTFALGWFQTLYGALLTWLFGFSFDVLRFGTAPFAAACGVLTYRLARKLDLRPQLAMFAALMLVLSPVETPVAASFMTDVYGCLFTLLCLYLGVLAATCSGNRRALALVTVATIVGLAGGATRQIVWATPIAVLLYFAWIKRKDRSALAGAAALLAALAGSILYLQRWYKLQPNSCSADIDAGTLRSLMHAPATAIILTLGLVLTVGMLAIPVFLCHSAQIRRMTAWTRAAAAIAILGYTGLNLWAGAGGVLAPFIGNIVTADGILFSGTELLGDKPVILTPLIRAILTALFLGSLAMIAKAFRTRMPSTARLLGWLTESGQATSRGVLAGLFPLFLLGYGLLIVARSAGGAGFMNDRYAIPVLPLLSISALSLLDRGPARIPWPAWVALALFGFYGIGTTHDYYSQARARTEAARILEKAGVPGTRYSVGLESDGWKQLEIAGFVRADWARPPAGVPWPGEPSASQRLWWFSKHAPDLDPKYFAAYSPVPGLAPASFPPIPYRTWFPPFERKLQILEVQSANVAASR